MSVNCLFFTGADGSGKSTLARFAVEEYQRRGQRAVLVWSRFNNYFSKPLLGLARLTGHNLRETHDGVHFGYHDFEGAPFYKYPFILTQAVDVNLVTAFRLRKMQQQADVLVFERSPWDTLADVILDTGCEALGRNVFGRWMTALVRNRGKVFWVSRSQTAILATRPELKYDRKLARKIDIYERLARRYGWTVLNNDRPLELVKEDLLRLLGV
jgi:predicted ATPase